MTSDPSIKAIASGHSAVITGGAGGIGFAAAQEFVSRGMNVLIADIDEQLSAEAKDSLMGQAVNDAKVLSFACDVSNLDSLKEMASFAAAEMGNVSVLMNNAGMGMDTGKPWETPEKWHQLLNVNLWGVINSTHAFVPAMLEAGKPGLVINTGSKQGITRPPGGSAYNLSKAGVIAFTESMAHEFRQIESCSLSAHLLVPGFTYTGMISKWLPEKPEGAWTSEQVVAFMLERLQAGDFYILCPDNDVTREMDEKRIQWYADDLIKNRPALSRWHPDFAEAFAKFMDEG